MFQPVSSSAILVDEYDLSVNVGRDYAVAYTPERDREPFALLSRPFPHASGR